MDNEIFRLEIRNRFFESKRHGQMPTVGNNYTYRYTEWLEEQVAMLDIPVILDPDTFLSQINPTPKESKKPHLIPQLHPILVDKRFTALEEKIDALEKLHEAECHCIIAGDVEKRIGKIEALHETPLHQKKGDVVKESWNSHG